MFLYPRRVALNSSQISLRYFHSSLQAKRLHSKKGSGIGFVFDIDGVLMRGNKAIPQAKTALELLNQHSVPFILLTNGGGVKEEDRVDFLSKTIGTYISPLQIVQSHTPIKALAIANNRFKRVLVVGGPENKARAVAENYGFEQVLLPIDIIRANSSVWPFHKYTEEQIEKWSIPNSESKVYGPGAEPIDAILVFNDSRDMGSDIQIILDLLSSHKGYVGTKRSSTESHSHIPSIPIIFSNNDFYWANDYPLSRFGQGAMRIIIEKLYQESNNVSQLDHIVLGKPFKISYDFAHSVLIDWQLKLLNNDTTSTEQILPELNSTPKNSPFDKIYMVGDNPASDIKGANDAGWESLLLRTGVFKDEDLPNIIAKPSGGIFDNVEEAVKYGLKENNY